MVSYKLSIPLPLERNSPKDFGHLWLSFSCVDLVHAQHQAPSGGNAYMAMRWKDVGSDSTCFSMGTLIHGKCPKSFEVWSFYDKDTVFHTTATQMSSEGGNDINTLYKFRVSEEYEDVPQKDLPAFAIIKGFKGFTSAHGIPHIDQARGKSYLFY